MLAIVPRLLRRALTRCALALSTLALLGALASPAHGSWFVNPELTASLAGWDLQSEDISWFSGDSEGCSDSGSAAVPLPVGFPYYETSISQCIFVGPVSTLYVSFAVSPSGLGTDARVRILFTDATCTTPIGSTIQGPLYSPEGGWTTVRASAPVPPGAGAAYVALFAGNPYDFPGGGSELGLLVDHAYAGGVDAIFADGNERGLCRWSANTP